MKTIIVTVIDEEADSHIKHWYVTGPDSDGVIRTEIGVWLGEFIGKYRYKTSEWINSRPTPKSD